MSTYMYLINFLKNALEKDRIHSSPPDLVPYKSKVCRTVADMVPLRNSETRGRERPCRGD